jgi:hypothetical protein
MSSAVAISTLRPLALAGETWTWHLAPAAAFMTKPNDQRCGD